MAEKADRFQAAQAERFRPYPQYRDSGLDWLGEIPAHWEVKKWRYCCHVSEGQIAPDDEQFRERVLIAPNHIESGTGRLLRLETAREQGAISGKYLVGPGDIVYSKIRPALNKVCIATGDWLCSADMYPVSITESRLQTRFLLYFMLSAPYVQLMVDQSMRVAMPKVNRDKLAACPLLVPDPAEQRAIAGFLDRETAKIDALVARKEWLIELLQEKRTVLITRAVTRGLDSNVPLKDSGVGCMGEIPAHWEVKRLKNVSTFVTSGSRGWAEFYSDEGPLFLRIGNVQSGSIDLNIDDVQHVDPPRGSEGERIRVKPGDVVVSITALIGAVAVISENLPETFVNQHLALIRLFTSAADSRWIAYCIMSPVGQTQFAADLYGGTKDGLGLDDVRSLLVLAPPIGEQERIVAYLDSQGAKLTRLIHSVRTAIDHLREFRTALISAAVTGKIDVREAAPR